MANNLKSNPKNIDTASGSDILGIMHVQEIQWIDDNADIADGDDLSITINGVAIAVKVQVANGENVCFWRMGPFAKPIPMTNFVCTVIDHGALLVFVA